MTGICPTAPNFLSGCSGSYISWTPIRGTTRLCKVLIIKHFTKSCFCIPQIWSLLVTFSSRQKNRETDKLEDKSEKHEQFGKEDNTADDSSRDSTNQNGAGTNILHIANSIILFRLYDIG